MRMITKSRGRFAEALANAYGFEQSQHEAATPNSSVQHSPPPTGATPWLYVPWLAHSHSANAHGHETGPGERPGGGATD